MWEMARAISAGSTWDSSVDGQRRFRRGVMEMVPLDVFMAPPVGMVVFVGVGVAMEAPVNALRSSDAHIPVDVDPFLNGDAPMDGDI